MKTEIARTATALFIGLVACDHLAWADNSAASRGFVPNEGAIPGQGRLKKIPAYPTQSQLPDTQPLATSSLGSVYPPIVDVLVGSVTPTADADVIGMWTSLANWPVVAIHASVLPNGHILTFGTPVGEAVQDSAQFDDWDPSQGLADTSHTISQNMTGINSFCGTSKLVQNAALLVAGGNSATSTAYWDEGTRSYNPVTTTPLIYPRWYSSLVRLPDNRVLIVGGSTPYEVDAYKTPNDNSYISTMPEIFTAGVGWSPLPAADSAAAFGAQDNRWWYPRAYVAPNGKVVGVSHNVVWTLDPSGAGSVTVAGQLSTTAVGASATSVMYDVGRILLAGGGVHSSTETAPGSNQATIIDVNGPTPASAPTSSMNFARSWSTAAVLPTGDVLVLGGTRIGNNGDPDAVYAGEIWSPASGRWSLTAPASAVRVYHSVAALLPNGAVLNAGGGVGGPVTNFNAQVYFPPYFFTRHGQSIVWADRPQVATISGIPSYGTQVALTLASNDRIASASLISLAAVTHSHNTDQRRIPFSFSQKATTVTVSMPSNSAILPPGYYQLHVVNKSGVPSNGLIIEVKSPIL